MKRFQKLNRIMSRNRQFKGLSFAFLKRKIIFWLFVSLFMMHFTSAIAEEKCSIAGVSDPSEFFSTSFKPIKNDVAPDGYMMIDSIKINLNDQEDWFSNRSLALGLFFQHNPDKYADPCYEKFIKEFVKTHKKAMADLRSLYKGKECSEKRRGLQINEYVSEEETGDESARRCKNISVGYINLESHALQMLGQQYGSHDSRWVNPDEYLTLDAVQTVD